MTKDSNAMDMYLNEVKDCEILSKEKILELAFQAKNGSKLAREKIARSHLRYVISLAKKYSRQYGISFEELVCSGNTGLAIALNKFEPSRNIAFTTYAQFWIRAEMNEAMNKAHDIVLPRKNAKKLSETCITSVSSIDDEDFRESSVCSENSWNPEENAERKEVYTKIQQVLSLINPQEADIIRLHFGIGCEKKTLQEIGDIYGYTKERIRQIEKTAFLHMKDGKGRRYLEGLCA